MAYSRIRFEIQNSATMTLVHTLSDAAFEVLSVPFTSDKPDGLGLGLAIVRKITESYAGHLEFKRLQPQGLAVTMVLPSAATNKECQS